MICNQGHEEEMKMNLEEQRQFILNGNMYNDLSDELVEAREKTVFLINEYNASFGKDVYKRQLELRMVRIYFICSPSSLGMTKLQLFKESVCLSS